MSEHGSANLPGTYGPEHVVREQPGVDPHHDGDDNGHGGVGKYLIVFAALIVLTGASFFTYTHYWPFKEDKHVTWAFMMAVSCTKAMLVIMFFMHLLWEANWKWVLTIPASFMSIFLMLMLVPDIGWRQNNGFARYSDERLLYAADPPQIEKHELEEAEQQLEEGTAH
ncbi:MAG TPA: cytochrome C oxidase subunit IV family protein [Lacipirellulaceae bacterium]|jgi:cytochrome c oxidase subunit 4|nr:cytochrome C oxidase subunit IV family protein [Lacipirellulaceae bacterium]